MPAAVLVLGNHFSEAAFLAGLQNFPRDIGVIDIFISDVFDSLEFFRSPGFGIRKLEMYGCHRLDFLSAFTAITVLI